MNKFSADHLANLAPAADSEDQMLLRYIWGGVGPKEACAAVWWEYARVYEPLRYWSRVLRRLGRVRALRPAIEPGREAEELLGHLYARGLTMGGRFVTDPVYCFTKQNHARNVRIREALNLLELVHSSIWTADDFPEKRWLNLRPDERAKICLDFADLTTRGVMPLVVADVRLLRGFEILEHWETMAAEAPLGSRDRDLSARFKRSGGYEEVVFSIPYHRGKDAVRDAFNAWLNARRQEELFDDYKERKTGKDLPIVKFPQALRDLALAQIRERRGSTEAAVRWITDARVQRHGIDVERLPGKRLPAVSERNLRDAVSRSKRFRDGLFKSRFDR